MSEWWTYSLSDFLLFSPRTYYRLFELYNAAVWPAQIVMLALGAIVLTLWLRPATWRGRLIAAILAAGWLWVAWFYLLQHYDTINWAAGYFAFGFAAQAVLLVWTWVVRDRLRIRRPSDLPGAVGLGMLTFALTLHPLIGPLLLGRSWMQVEIFGVAPDPTVIATLGALTAAARPHWRLVVLPLLWCVIGGATLWTMESPDWPVLPTAAVVALTAAVAKSLARADPESVSCVATGSSDGTSQRGA